MQDDLAIWHPYTQHGLQAESTNIAAGSGAYLFAADRRRIIDAISSWWVVAHGHCHPRIVSAIQQQAGKLTQIIFAGHTHDRAEELAALLLKFTPAGLDYVFFSDSGSTSLELALKMALGYWYNIGEPRTRIVMLEKPYHGDTVGRCRLVPPSAVLRGPVCAGRWCFRSLPAAHTRRDGNTGDDQHPQTYRFCKLQGPRLESRAK
ncbi:aminotransferase class III-fold pyridoxal phosphate-dependent enzyme [Bradyrhizobium sp. WSM 1791]|uniref:Aminotransferase class III-fold pyridoxal phosphate-dependent enzyme n=1 Tax=Bradyrhizobium australiense TaxID=2721161 RepID=A0A7Y4GYW5_9BRAD|nr:aminotransferase class III-fold pyridoxal phosphate-dependent enzyme [Bradyrhizobium australiense]